MFAVCAAVCAAGTGEAVAPQPAATESAFDAFFAEFARKRDGIESLTAAFSQENTTAGDVVYSGGTVVYQKPRRIVFRYEMPDPGTTYLIDGRKAYEYEPDAKQLQIYSLEDSPRAEVFFLGFSDNTRALRQGYDVALFELTAADRHGAVPMASQGIVIRPKAGPGEEDEVSFREVRLYLREQDYLPARIHIVNDEESEVSIELSEFHVNEKLDPARTRIAVPEGAKVIEDDVPVEVVGPGGKQVPEAAPEPAGEARP